MRLKQRACYRVAIPARPHRRASERDLLLRWPRLRISRRRSTSSKWQCGRCSA